MAGFTTAALLGSAAISGGSSILGGLFGKSAAQKAAEAQQKAAAQAGAKVEQAVADVNPSIAEAARNAGADVVGQARNAGAGIVSAAGEAGNYATDVARKTASAYDPYAQLGAQSADTLKTGLADGGTFNKSFTSGDFTADPGYQFRLSQGMKLLQQKNGALGAATGGGAAKDYLKFNSDLASQEFGNAFTRNQQETQARFEREKFGVGTGLAAVGAQGNILNDAATYAGDKLYGSKVAEGGLNLGAAEYQGSTNVNATNKIADNTIGGARTAADYLTQGANAKAAGTMAGSNSLINGFTGAANAGAQALSLSAILKALAKQKGSYDDYGNFTPAKP